MDRRNVLAGVAGAALAMVAGGVSAEFRHRCEACRPNGGRRFQCGPRHRCVRGRCVPKTLELVCGDAYKVCNNGKLPECNGGVAECPGHKPATPYCSRG
jgi:hypothetical protein